MKAILVAISVLSIIVCGVASQNCANQPHGSFVPDIANCSAWYRCDASGPVHGTCGPNFSFNPQTQNCDWPENVDCFVCPAEGVSNILVAGTCNQFVRCANGHGVVNTCPGDLLFNPTLGECDLSTNVDCSIAFVCPNLPPGVSSYHQDQTNCSVALECIGGVAEPIRRECSPQLHFNINIGMCDSPLNSNCSLSDQPDQPGPGPGQPEIPNVDCAVDGVKPHPATCESYIVCAGGHPNVIPCSPGMHFNQALSVCDLPQSANCVRSALGRFRFMRETFRFA